MVLVDVEESGALALPHQLCVRAGLYTMVAEALAAAGVPWKACYSEDRDDSVVVLVPPEYSKARLVEVLPEALVRAVHRHNASSHHDARARLRVAVHAGEVVFGRDGVTSTSLTMAFRLLNTASLTMALAASPGVAAMIVSRLIFDDIVRHSASMDPATFRPVEVAFREIRDLAWIALPDCPYPPDPTVLQRPTADPVPLGTAPGSPASTGSGTDGTGRGLGPAPPSHPA